MAMIPFLSAFGLGAIVTALVQAWLSNLAYRRQRDFQEKKESYVGFLDALHQSEIEQSPAAALNVGSWQNRIELVGSRAVIAACRSIEGTNPIGGEIHPARPAALRRLKEAMRADIGVGKSR